MEKERGWLGENRGEGRVDRDLQAAGMLRLLSCHQEVEVHLRLGPRTTALSRGLGVDISRGEGAG